MTPRPSSSFHDVIGLDPWLVMKAGRLQIDRIDAAELAKSYGTPLFVVVEAALQRNLEQLRSALEKNWPAENAVFFSVKSNPNLRVARFFAEAGTGIDAFSSNEMRAALLAARDGVPIVLNGNAKELAALRLASEVDGTVNIDSVEEIDAIETIAKHKNCTFAVNIRLKPDSSHFASTASDYFGVSGGQSMIDFIDDEKWGFSTEAAIGLVKRLSGSSAFSLQGFSSHIGRISTDPNVFTLYGEAIAEMAHTIAKATGFVPRVIDAGGGWPRLRDPELRSYQINTHPIDDYIAAFAKGFRAKWVNAELPILWLEPGRYLVGNAVILLTEVIGRKADLNRIWLTVDASTNVLARVDTSKSRHFIVPATDAADRPDEDVEIVGPTCVHSVLASNYAFPRSDVGDLLAILDTGMYAESTANNFNLLPRPACIYVSDAKAALIRRAETFEDIMRPQLDCWKE